MQLEQSEDTIQMFEEEEKSNQIMYSQIVDESKQLIEKKEQIKNLGFFKIQTKTKSKQKQDLNLCFDTMLNLQTNHYGDQKQTINQQNLDDHQVKRERRREDMAKEEQGALACIFSL